MVRRSSPSDAHAHWFRHPCRVFISGIFRWWQSRYRPPRHGVDGFVALVAADHRGVRIGCLVGAGCAKLVMERVGLLFISWYFWQFSPRMCQPGFGLG